MTRPSETLTAAVGSIVGAILIIVGSVSDIRISTEVSGAITVLVAWIASGVTWYIARRQRAGTLASGAAGEVRPGAFQVAPGALQPGT